MLPKLLVVLGPTAVGKTKFAVQLASKFSGEIISADSRQVYKHMDIGTGKDLSEYKIENTTIPHHLIDIISPLEDYNLFRFVNDFQLAFNDIISRNNLPILTGGTAMYLNAILQNYVLPKAEFDDAEKKYSDYSIDTLKNILLTMNKHLHNTTDLTDRSRIIRAICISEKNFSVEGKSQNFSPIVIGVKTETKKIKEKIAARLKHRLQNGMIDEAKNLLQIGVDFERMKYFGLEYKFLAEYLQGKMNFNDMHQKLRAAIFNFAKRQMTWFRKMEREGIVINWFEPEQIADAEILVTNFLADN